MERPIVTQIKRMKKFRYKVIGYIFSKVVYPASVGIESMMDKEFPFCMVMLMSCFRKERANLLPVLCCNLAPRSWINFLAQLPNAPRVSIPIRVNI